MTHVDRLVNTERRGSLRGFIQNRARPPTDSISINAHLQIQLTMRSTKNICGADRQTVDPNVVRRRWTWLRRDTRDRGNSKAYRSIRSLCVTSRAFRTE